MTIYRVMRDTTQQKKIKLVNKKRKWTYVQLLIARLPCLQSCAYLSRHVRIDGTQVLGLIIKAKIQRQIRSLSWPCTLFPNPLFVWLELTHPNHNRLLLSPELVRLAAIPRPNREAAGLSRCGRSGFLAKQEWWSCIIFHYFHIVTPPSLHFLFGFPLRGHWSTLLDSYSPLLHRENQYSYISYSAIVTSCVLCPEDTSCATFQTCLHLTSAIEFRLSHQMVFLYEE